MRKSLDVTQTELAHSSGISQSTIAKIESGKISASYETVVKLFDTLESLKNKEHKDITADDVASKSVVTAVIGVVSETTGKDSSIILDIMV